MDNFCDDRFQENVPLANLLLLGFGAVRLPIGVGGRRLEGWEARGTQEIIIVPTRHI